jgi:hypothetical protein
MEVKEAAAISARSRIVSLAWGQTNAQSVILDILSVIQLVSNVSWLTAQIAPQQLSVSHVWLDIPSLEDLV